MTYEQELQTIFDKMDGLSDFTWDDIADMLNYPYDVCTLRKSLAGKYGGKAVAEFYRDKLNTSEEAEDIMVAKNELYKERVKLQDVQRMNRNSLREEARFERLVESLEGALWDFEPIDLKPLMGKNQITDYVPAILQLSDWHLGSLIDNQWNFYDIEEAKHRVAIITRKAISKCLWHNVSDLVIEINGDMVHGMINLSNRVDSEVDVLEQCCIVSELLAQCVAEISNGLSDQLKSIKVITTLGNHGRLTSSKKDCNTGENFEMLIPKMLRLRLPNITIIDSKGLDFLKYNIGKKVICVAHGQNDKLKNAVGDFAKLYKVVPDEVHLAHYHSYTDINDCNCFVTVNGCLDGADDYAITLRKISDPSQNLIVFDVDGDRCIYSLSAKE